VGSLYYSTHLDEKEKDNIRYYFNYDMIGSIQPAWFIYNDANSAIGAQRLLDVLRSQGKPAELRYVPFRNRLRPSCR
jgi:Zn-dependent M28 family amino/carboxypeptidase